MRFQKTLEVLDQITDLSRALRQGGPDPMDLQELSDALEEAVYLAKDEMERLIELSETQPSEQYPSTQQRQAWHDEFHTGGDEGSWGEFLARKACDWSAARQRERDAQVCEAERVEEETGATEDVAYNLAIEHCAEAIRSQDRSVDANKMVAQPAPAQSERPLIARALAEWHEDDGPVSWWAWCGHEWAGEPAWIGTPLDDDWPGYHTHWTPHPQPTREGEAP